MAEVLGTVASGIALSSMAIQLNDNISDLHRFLQDVKDAPYDLRAISEDLQSLRSLLVATGQAFGIGVAAKHPALDFDLLPRTLTEIQKLVGELMKIKTELTESQRKLKRGTGSFRVVIKKSRIEKLQRALKDSTTSLNTILMIQVSVRSSESMSLAKKDIIKKETSSLSVSHSESQAGTISIFKQSLIFLTLFFVVDGEPENVHAALHKLSRKCESLQQILSQISEELNPFRSAKLEIQRLQQALNDLGMLLRYRSSAQIPTSDYLPALNITDEALDQVLETWAVRAITTKKKEALAWLSRPGIQHNARKYLKRLEQSRAALIAAQLAV
jgi:DNA repair exonuclease SbcCD ATPase subunit